MSQTPGRARFPLEPFHKLPVAHELRRDQLQGYVSVGAKMRGQIDRTHAPLTEQTLKAVLIIENLTDVTIERCHENRFRFSIGVGRSD